jgi:hypothetical protein
MIDRYEVEHDAVEPSAKMKNWKKADGQIVPKTCYSALVLSDA